MRKVTDNLNKVITWSCIQLSVTLFYLSSSFVSYFMCWLQNPKRKTNISYRFIARIRKFKVFVNSNGKLWEKYTFICGIFTSGSVENINISNKKRKTEISKFQLPNCSNFLLSPISKTQIIDNIKVTLSP